MTLMVEVKNVNGPYTTIVCEQTYAGEQWGPHEAPVNEVRTELEPGAGKVFTIWKNKHLSVFEL